VSAGRIAALVVVMVGLTCAPGSGQSDVAPTAINPETVIGAPDGPPLSGDELERRTQELASIMRCPVCQALSVADSPTVSALAMREEARDLLAAGYSENQVLEYFEKAYGEFILLAPRKRGLNWFVWLTPIAVLLVGGALVFARLGGSVARTAGDETAALDEDDDLNEYAERVRREIAG
jgi:cytochrome c-type biogenesis protein CcmH